VTRYEHTQSGHVVIWTLFAAAVLVALQATVKLGPHREPLLVVSVVLLITAVLFYKLTITIDNVTLRASLGIGLIRK
jgi:multidrug efflux pump subunit AcrB